MLNDFERLNIINVEVRTSVQKVPSGKYVSAIMFGEFETEAEAKAVLEYMHNGLKNSIPEASVQ